MIPRDGRLLFIFNLSNAESRGTWKDWRTFASIRMTARLKGATLTFFKKKKCLRGGEDSERGETKFSAGVTVTAPTTMHAEERQHEFSQRRSEVRAGRLSSRFQNFQAQSVSHRVQTRPLSSRSVHHGIFPDVYFYTHSLQRPHERRPMASRREQVSALFFCSLNTTSSHRMFSMGYRRAKSTQGNTNFQKRIFLANNFGITTRGP